MANAEKVAAVAELTERFQESAGAVLTEYRGLTVAQMRELRGTLGEAATFAVVKNTLTKIAVEQAGLEKDRIELRSIDYHEQVRQNYLSQAKLDPDLVSGLGADLQEHFKKKAAAVQRAYDILTRSHT